MYSSWAQVYDAIYSFKDYASETTRIAEIVRERFPDARSLLDVACGTGKHLEQLRKQFTAEGLDFEPALLEIAAGRLAGIPLHRADMRDFDLGRTFDVVTCLFSSIGHMTSLADLNRAVAAMARHLSAPGLLIIEPWLEPSVWQPGTVHADWVDEPDLKVSRITLSGLEGERVATMDMHFLVGKPESVDYFAQRLEARLHTQEEYEEAMRSSGLEISRDPEGLMGRGLYIGSRPA